MKLGGCAVVLLALAAVGAGAQITRVATGLPGGIPTAVREDGQPGQPEGQPSGQVHDDLLDGLDRLGANAKEKSEVNLDKNMLALVGNRGGHYGSYGDLQQKMDFITVRSYEYAGKDQYQKSDLDALRHKLDNGGWSHIVRSQSDNETSDICLKAGGDGLISDMVILSAEAREVSIVHLHGHFRMEDINGAMGATMGISRGVGASAMGPAMGTFASSSSRHTSSPPAAPAAPAAPAPPPMAPTVK